MIGRPPRSPLFPNPPLSRPPRTGARTAAGPASPDPPLSHPRLDRGRPRLRQPRLPRSEEHTSELQSRQYLVCRLLLEKKNAKACTPVLGVLLGPQPSRDASD